MRALFPPPLPALSWCVSGGQEEHNDVFIRRNSVARTVIVLVCCSLIAFDLLSLCLSSFAIRRVEVGTFVGTTKIPKCAQPSLKKLFYPFIFVALYISPTSPERNSRSICATWRTFVKLVAPTCCAASFQEFEFKCLYFQRLDCVEGEHTRFQTGVNLAFACIGFLGFALPCVSVCLLVLILFICSLFFVFALAIQGLYFIIYRNWQVFNVSLAHYADLKLIFEQLAEWYGRVGVRLLPKAGFRPLFVSFFSGSFSSLHADAQRTIRQVQGMQWWIFATPN